VNTFVLSPETKGFPVESLLERAGPGGIEIRDRDGKVLGYLLTADNPDAAAYVQASRDLEQHEQEVQEASQRRGGVSTAELLQRAQEAAQKSDGARG
jgi:hypothetical protein